MDEEAVPGEEKTVPRALEVEGGDPTLDGAQVQRGEEDTIGASRPPPFHVTAQEIHRDRVPGGDPPLAGVPRGLAPGRPVEHGVDEPVLLKQGRVGDLVGAEPLRAVLRAPQVSGEGPRGCTWIPGLQRQARGRHGGDGVQDRFEDGVEVPFRGKGSAVQSRTCAQDHGGRRGQGVVQRCGEVTEPLRGRRAHHIACVGDTGSIGPDVQGEHAQRHEAEKEQQRAGAIEPDSWGVRHLVPVPGGWTGTGGAPVGSVDDPRPAMAARKVSAGPHSGQPGPTPFRAGPTSSPLEILGEPF